MQTRYRPLAATLTTVVVWSAAYPAIGLALREFEPIPLGALRFAIAALPMLMVLAWTRPSLPRGWDLVRFAASAALGIAAYNMLLNSGQQTVSAGAASFLIKLESVVTALLAVVLLGEYFSRRAWIGTAVCVAGAAMIASGQPAGLGADQGSLLIVAAAVSSSISFVVQKRLVADYGALTTAAVNTVFGALLLLPWLGPGLVQMQLASLDCLLAVGFLGLFPAALGYFTWMVTLESLGAARASNVLYLVPPLTLALAYLVADEVPGWLTLAGGLVVLAGVALVNIRSTAVPTRGEATWEK